MFAELLLSGRPTAIEELRKKTAKVQMPPTRNADILRLIGVEEPVVAAVTFPYDPYCSHTDVPSRQMERQVGTARRQQASTPESSLSTLLGCVSSFLHSCFRTRTHEL